MEMVFHLGVHCTDGDRLLKTLLNNREWLLGKGTEIVTPQRHRGLFEEALMALNGGRATPEMEQIMLDAMLTAEAPRRVVLSTPTFMGAPGRVVRMLDEAAQGDLLRSAARYRANAARFRAGLRRLD